MGWTCVHGSSRKGTIEQLTQDWSKDGRGVRYIAKQFKGSAFKGVLYAVGQPYTVGKDEDTKDRFILVVLLEYWTKQGGWAYKDMDESFHPYYYSCPMKYLDMTPTVVNQEWRDGVRAYWEQRRIKRGLAKTTA